MMRRVANLAILCAAVALCYGMQTTKPHYAELIAPIPAYGDATDTVGTRTFDIGVDKLVFARTLKLDQFGKQKLLTTDGVWAIATVDLAAKDQSAVVSIATWRGSNGLRYRQSERVSSAPGLPPIFVDPGLPGKGRFVFEVRPDEVNEAILLVSSSLFAALDSQARIALGKIALGADGMPVGTVDTYDLSAKP